MDILSNDDRLEVKGIGTWELHLRVDCTIIIHGVLFALGIRINLISVIVHLRQSFELLWQLCLYKQ